MFIKILDKLKCWINRTVSLLGILFIFIALTVGSMPVQASTLANQNNASNSIDLKLERQILEVIRKNPGIIREALQAEEVQKRQKQQEVVQRFKQDAQKNPGNVIGNSPVKGAKDQKLLLIEFTDFQCPYCTEAHRILKQFMERNQDNVTLVYKHYPLTTIHPEAISAANAAWAAHQQGKFWQYHDALFEQQSKLGEKLYVEIAKKLQLDLAQFNQQRESKEFLKVLDQDQQMAELLGIQGTPFFFVNGETISGAVPLPDLEKLVASMKIE